MGHFVVKYGVNDELLIIHTWECTVEANRRQLDPARRQTLRREVTHALREAILSGAYQPGAHLVEAEIAELMGVSHGPVREALRELEAEDLIVIEPHRGGFVKSFTADDIREIYSLRSLLETAMVLRAIERITEDDLVVLDALIAQMRVAEAAENAEAEIELDLAFHSKLCALSGHRRMIEAWNRLAFPIRLFLTMAIPKHLSLHEAVESHIPIVEALRQRNAVAATKHMEAGVLAIGERIATAMTPSAPVVPLPDLPGGKTAAQ